MNSPMRYVVAVAVIALIAAANWFVGEKLDEAETAGILPGKPVTAIAHVEAPHTLSAQGHLGAKIFEARCVSCHGVNGEGVAGVGPPLVHAYYQPDSHSDETFQRAVAQGVRQHHWQFGDMPPVEGLTPGDATLAIAYIREVQHANGIR